MKRERRASITEPLPLSTEQAGLFDLGYIEPVGFTSMSIVAILPETERPLRAVVQEYLILRSEWGAAARPRGDHLQPLPDRIRLFPEGGRGQFLETRY